jgi:YgiT-type zinc finger domain-containing protein
MMCKGEMEKNNVSYTIDREGYHLFIERIPAYVCIRCGERYFEESEVSAIQDMMKTFEEKLKNIVQVAS